MSRGNWRAVLALVGWLILCGAQPPAKQVEGGNRTRNTIPAAQPAPALTPSPGPKFTPYVGYDPDPCYHAKDKDAADLCAQWRAAIAAEKAAHEARRAGTWAIVATLLSGAALAALLWTLVQGRAGLKKARKANIIARDTARRQLRAYLAIDIVGFSGLPKSEKPTYSCVLRNCGQTPARNVKGEIHAYFDDWDHAPQLPDINSVLSRPGQTLGPDRTLGAFRRSLTLSPADKARWLKNEITLYLVVRHVYEDVFGKRHRLDQMYKARPRDGGDAMDAICDAERQMDENDSLDQPPSADEAAL